MPGDRLAAPGIIETSSTFTAAAIVPIVIETGPATICGGITVELVTIVPIVIDAVDTISGGKTDVVAVTISS
jgi:hypothetical protein